MSLMNDNLRIDQTLGLGTFNRAPEPPGGHVHDSLEISVFMKGAVTMRYGGHAVTVPPDQLIVHWGMLPHQMLRRDAGARVVGIHMPLPWVLSWNLPGTLVPRLLDLDYIIVPPRTSPCSDLALLTDWHRLMSNPVPGNDRIVLTEVQARLMRMAVSMRAAPTAAVPSHAPNTFSRALQTIITRFRDPLRLKDIASAAGISERQLTRLFFEFTGQTVNGYITHLRLLHAQRMLMTTDAKITDIIYASGFTCTTQFYARFKGKTGMNPAHYRGQIAKAAGARTRRDDTR